MKKVLSLILALLMCLSLCACAGETKSNAIELTPDNYDDYLKININLNHPKDAGKNKRYVGPKGEIQSDGSFSSYLSLDVSVEGVSSHFLYSDIVIVVRAKGSHLICETSRGLNGFSAYDTDWLPVVFTHKVRCNLDIAGSGKGIDEEKYSVSDNIVFPTAFAAGGFDFDYEIVSIEGKVTPVN